MAAQLKPIDTLVYQSRLFSDGKNVKGGVKPGHMASSDWTMQFLADMLNASIDRPKITETTALGAAWLAGMRAGIYPNQQDFAASWALDKCFEPTMDDITRVEFYQGWQDAVRRTLSTN